MTETFIEREVSKLIELDNMDVRIFSLQKASGETSDAVLSSTSYTRLDWMTFLKSLIYILGKSDRILESFRIVKPINLKDLYLFIKAIGYTRIIEEFAPDHIHVHFMSDPSTIVLIASVILNIPFSISGHARDVFITGTHIKEKVNRAKFVTLCNTAAYNKCLEYADENTSHRIKLNYHGVDSSKLVRKEKKILNPEKTYILSIGRLVEKKGFRYLIEASKLLKDQNVNHEIHIVGASGDLYGELKCLIDENSLSDFVYIEGEGKGIPHSELISYYHKADMFVLPSIDTGVGDSDGVPNVIVEAALASLPIVTTDAGGIKDLITHDETGLLVPQRDPEMLAVQIRKLIDHPEFGIKLSNACRIKAMEMFDLEKNIETLQGLLLI